MLSLWFELLSAIQNLVWDILHNSNSRIQAESKQNKHRHQPTNPMKPFQVLYLQSMRAAASHFHLRPFWKSWLATWLSHQCRNKFQTFKEPLQDKWNWRILQQVHFEIDSLNLVDDWITDTRKQYRLLLELWPYTNACLIYIIMALSQNKDETDFW